MPIVRYLTLGVLGAVLLRCTGYDPIPPTRTDHIVMLDSLALPPCSGREGYAVPDTIRVSACANVNGTTDLSFMTIPLPPPSDGRWSGFTAPANDLPPDSRLDPEWGSLTYAGLPSPFSDTFALTFHSDSCACTTTVVLRTFPAPPDSVFVTRNTTTALTIAWPAVGDVDRYRVVTERGEFITTAPRFTDTELGTLNRRVSYAVMAVDGAGRESAPRRVEAVVRPGDDSVYVVARDDRFTVRVGERYPHPDESLNVLYNDTLVNDTCRMTVEQVGDETFNPLIRGCYVLYPDTVTAAGFDTLRYVVSSRHAVNVDTAMVVIEAEAR
jgi:hypothetical protein